MIQPVELTPEAVVEVKHIFANKNIPEGYGLRIGVKGGGCGGVSYVLGFDMPKENDLRYEIEGVPMLVEKKHTMYLLGLVVDFYEGADARGFLFTNPSLKEKDEVKE